VIIPRLLVVVVPGLVVIEALQGLSRLKSKTVNGKMGNRRTMVDRPLSRNLNSIVPDKGRFEPSRPIVGLKGPQLMKAIARF
jgi:hypothetical protein